MEDDIRDIEVFPERIHIGDIDGIPADGNIPKFKPYGYQCIVSFGPYAMVKLLRWCIRNGYLTVNGELYWKDRNKIRRIKRNGK